MRKTLNWKYMEGGTCWADWQGGHYLIESYRHPNPYVCAVGYDANDKKNFRAKLPDIDQAKAACERDAASRPLPASATREE